MLLIIGLMLCLYLVVKGLEFQHRQGTSTREDGRGSIMAAFSTAICILGAVGFAFLLVMQASTSPY